MPRFNPDNKVSLARLLEGLAATSRKPPKRAKSQFKTSARDALLGQEGIRTFEDAANAMEKRRRANDG